MITRDATVRCNLGIIADNEDILKVVSMFITKYKYEDGTPKGWRFSEMNFGKMNLLVGSSGSGKSRLLNTLKNIALFISTNNGYKSGFWNMEFCTEGRLYKWSYTGAREKTEVVEESLEVWRDDQWIALVTRSNGDIHYEGGKLPKLPGESSCLYLLKEEENIAPAYRGFGRLIRRNFFGSELETACGFGNIPSALMEIEKKQLLEVLAGLELPLNVKLSLLKSKAEPVFRQIVDLYRNIFPAIENIDIGDASEMVAIPGKVPVLTFKERKVDQPYMISDLSSGMQKVLLIIADVLLAKKNSVIMFDEYENSLGVNAIDFFPDLIADFGDELQFFVTSHHPYLINNMPISTWQVFHREGAEVTVRSGEELRRIYGESTQQAFIQLINDPFYRS